MNVYKIRKEPSWTEWNDWDCCSAACGNGTMSRNRKCLDEYGNGADDCVGTSEESITCVQWNESCDASWKVNVYKIPQSGLRIGTSSHILEECYLGRINSRTLISGMNGVNGTNVRSHVAMEQLQE